MDYFRGKLHASRSQSRPTQDGETIRANPLAPAREDIDRLAYSYWEARAGRGGSPLEDWLRAERELKGRRD